MKKEGTEKKEEEKKQLKLYKALELVTNIVYRVVSKHISYIYIQICQMQRIYYI